MIDIAISATRVVAALVLVVLNGFFVASEFAFVRVRSTSVEQLVGRGAPGSGALQDVMGSLDDYLAATQLGITLASLGLGWVGEPAIVALIEPALGPLLPRTSSTSSRSRSGSASSRSSTSCSVSWRRRRSPSRRPSGSR